MINMNLQNGESDNINITCCRNIYENIIKTFYTGGTWTAMKTVETSPDNSSISKNKDEQNRNEHCFLWLVGLILIIWSIQIFTPCLSSDYYKALCSACISPSQPWWVSGARWWLHPLLRPDCPLDDWIPPVCEGNKDDSDPVHNNNKNCLQ